MKAEAREWLELHPADRWRLRCSMKTVIAPSGTRLFEDDLTLFFRRSQWEVSSADIFRWRAAVEAERELTEGA